MYLDDVLFIGNENGTTYCTFLLSNFNGTYVRCDIAGGEMIKNKQVHLLRLY